ncbi:hypothetical protein G5V58_10930 [Nocardioides anomalus]|uniref:Uncharacterized protein n=1 Tax=Nocardioides anomalus TaxID=2712223 RepID=A0A6G6WDT1_9ACTN|nr:hypothetical protein [Nocardioides anomalus]QIG43200.1 hypothetical protein G5V58_10930 [Nocardioides anomalus]
MVALLVVVGILVVVGALGWWGSRRSRRQLPGPGNAQDSARGEAYLRGQQHHVDDLGPHL